jgi:hypothetical protein
LLSLEEVRQGDRLLEVWVEIVVDHLSLCDVDVLVVTFLEYSADGIRLTESVEILQFSSRDVQVDLAAQGRVL